jgi:hypothetical protein
MQEQLIGGYSLQPADITGAIDAAHRRAEKPVKAGRNPTFRRIGINYRQNSPVVESKFYFGVFAMQRFIAVPGSLEIRLFDRRTQFRNEPLHRVF